MVAFGIFVEMRMLALVDAVPVFPARSTMRAFNTFVPSVKDPLGATFTLPFATSMLETIAAPITCKEPSSN